MPANLASRGLGGRNLAVAGMARFSSLTTQLVFPVGVPSPSGFGSPVVTLGPGASVTISLIGFAGSATLGTPAVFRPSSERPRDRFRVINKRKISRIEL